VEENFTITPATEGVFSWEDDKTLVFDPTNDIPKETDYTVNIKAGVINQWGGKTKDDIVFSFKTIGRVIVNGLYPASDTYGWEPSTTNISVTFNQEVDHGSAQEHFSISPWTA